MICLLGGPQTTMGRGFHSWWAGARLTTTTAAIARYCCFHYYVVHQHFPNGPLQRKGWRPTQVLNNFHCRHCPKKRSFLVCIYTTVLCPKKGRERNCIFSSARASHQKKNLTFSFSLFFWFQMLFSKSWQSPIKPFLLLPLFVLAEKCHRQVSWILEEKRASLNSHSRGR